MECDVCRRYVSDSEHNDVCNHLNSLPIEEFENIVDSAGVAEHWQTAILCRVCLEYYLA